MYVLNYEGRAILSEIPAVFEVSIVCHNALGIGSLSVFFLRVRV